MLIAEYLENKISKIKITHHITSNIELVLWWLFTLHMFYCCKFTQTGSNYVNILFSKHIGDILSYCYKFFHSIILHFNCYSVFHYVPIWSFI